MRHQIEKQQLAEGSHFVLCLATATATDVEKMLFLNPDFIPHSSLIH